MIKIKSHSDLNPLLWDQASHRMLPEVRDSLIRIAKDFRSFIGMDFDIEDVIVTGSQANYNYTEHSDLDLHLIVDYSNVPCDRELEELFDTKRHLYNKKYDIRIHGIQVEVYVESTEEPVTGAIYSVASDSWLQRPPKPHTIEIDSAKVAKQASVWNTIITHALESGDIEILKQTLSLLRRYRKSGLAATGEYNTANLVYKDLRNRGTITRMADRIDAHHAKDLGT